MLPFIFITLIVSQFISTDAVNCKGCVPLDSYSFDKVISKFKAAVIKFDVAYPYGAKHDEFSKVSESTYQISDLLIGEVGVKDYGEKENADLAERYKVSKDDFPIVKLFVAGKSEPYTFTNPDFTADNIKKFIRSNSDIHIGLRGCVETFDILGTKFIKAADADARKTVLREAEDAWDKLTSRTDQQAAEMYVKMMRKTLEKGTEFIPSEMKRVMNLSKGKLSKEKKEEMEQRLNILQSFVHDEL